MNNRTIKRAFWKMNLYAWVFPVKEKNTWSGYYSDMIPGLRCQVITPQQVCLWVCSRRDPNDLVYAVKTIRGFALAR